MSLNKEKEQLEEKLKQLEEQKANDVGKSDGL